MRDPSQKRVRILFWTFFFLGSLIVVFLLYWKHPTDYGVIPSCPTRTFLGIYCPGCGFMRATHFLLNGHFVESLRYNPLVIPLIPIIFVLLIRSFWESWTQRYFPLPCEISMSIMIFIVFVAMFILRNIPLEIFDCLRPP